ncbi:hypothetical protein SAMN02799631_02895 [Methylobacterium sp. 174MFSha1.1]|uniref:hypothetical protein n=1 Tax=Methylobacterium sp. 174MFSha1.1 TaxID=1502749 RepID=UPI0008E2E284|nr:hypothetical protein [Methylobacterium sp. 174MFSha1.1]SFU88410.1 hypothetical protein SAMN02799631_02895 [Methylobacterium sp. 174MFSha1.1]
MIVARVILMSAMLTAGVVEMTKTTAAHLAGDAREAVPAEMSVEAPAGTPRALPVSTAPAAGRACTEAAWPFRPDTCLQPEGAPQGAAPRRPVRMIEELRPALPVRMPGRVSVG